MLQTQNPQKKTQQHTVCAGALCVVRFHEITLSQNFDHDLVHARASHTASSRHDGRCRARVPRVSSSPRRTGLESSAGLEIGGLTSAASPQASDPVLSSLALVCFLELALAARSSCMWAVYGAFVFPATRFL